MARKCPGFERSLFSHQSLIMTPLFFVKVAHSTLLFEDLYIFTTRISFSCMFRFLERLHFSEFPTSSPYYFSAHCMVSCLASIRSHIALSDSYCRNLSECYSHQAAQVPTEQHFTILCASHSVKNKDHPPLSSKFTKHKAAICDVVYPHSILGQALRNTLQLGFGNCKQRAESHMAFSVEPRKEQFYMTSAGSRSFIKYL